MMPRLMTPSPTMSLHHLSLLSRPPPVHLQGELDVGYRITVAGRDGKLYHIRNGELSQTIIQLEAQPVGLVRACGAEGKGAGGVYGEGVVDTSQN